MVDLSLVLDTLPPVTTGKIIQFIGSRAGEGTTTLVRTFAQLSAIRFNKTVLLLDTEGPQEIPMQEPERNVDLLDMRSLVTRKQHDASIVPHVFVHPAPTRSSTLSSIFFQSLANGVLDDLRQQFDLILVDSPPATASSAGLAIACHVDGVILVVEAEKTRWPVVNNVKNKIARAGGNILGVILNKRRYHIPAWLYKRL